MNTGNAVYGLIGATVLLWALVALVIFLFIWDFSQTFMLRVLGWGLGLTITMLFKTLLTKTCRRSFRGFYRTNPRSYNIGTLALECWFLGLGASVLVGRISQFLLAAVIWVGRIDVPYLSPNVHVGGYAFDAVPRHFVKELLVHEAHRHPYIERTTQMCLMRIKSKTFASPAGAAWRQVFVQSFMPWLKKYRVFQEGRIHAALQELDFRKEELDEGAKNVAARFLEDVRGDTLAVMSGINAVGEQLVSGTTAVVRGAHEGVEAVTTAAQDVATTTGALVGNVTSAALSLSSMKDNDSLGNIGAETMTPESNASINVKPQASVKEVGQAAKANSEPNPHEPACSIS
jgi:hypothetical protein